jgi:hypothetical protein
VASAITSSAPTRDDLGAHLAAGDPSLNIVEVAVNTRRPMERDVVFLHTGATDETQSNK